MSAATPPNPHPVCKKWLLGTCPLGKHCKLPHVARPEHFLSTANERGLACVLSMLSTQNCPAHCAKFFSYQPCQERCEFLHLFRKHELSSALQEELATEDEEEEETEVSSAGSTTEFKNKLELVNHQSQLRELEHKLELVNLQSQLRESKLNAEIDKLKAKLVESEYKEKVARLEAELAAKA